MHFLHVQKILLFFLYPKQQINHATPALHYRNMTTATEHKELQYNSDNQSTSNILDKHNIISIKLEKRIQKTSMMYWTISGKLFRAAHCRA